MKVNGFLYFSGAVLVSLSVEKLTGNPAWGCLTAGILMLWAALFMRKGGD